MRAIIPPRHVWVEEIMGIPISVHVRSRGPQPATGTRRAVDACFSELRDIDRVFSTYRDDSDINRIRRGELTIKDADPRVSRVAELCCEAERETNGLFSADWQGWFDPTGLVKGWAVEIVARTHLASLVPQDIAVGINAGGDMQLFTAPDTDWRWNVAIADPGHPGEVAATITIENGAVATSGVAERGRHIVDPRTGNPAVTVASATVVADGLAQADLWATAAVVAGYADRSWISRAETRTGLIIAADGRTSRWLGRTCVDTVAV